MAKNYTITNRDYQNTGGYCMVSIFTVHDRAAQATRYVVCSDDALTWQSFDIIANDLPDGLDYNDAIIETHIYDTLTCEPCWDNPVATMDDEKFALFKYCEFEHYKNNYDNFGIITELTVDRLPAELYSTLDEEVITWHKEHGATVTTNGYQVWPSEGYGPPPANGMGDLRHYERTISDFKEWFDRTISEAQLDDTLEKYYEKNITIVWNGRALELTFAADEVDAISGALQEIIDRLN